jgi:hypothetical protein
LPEKVCLKNSDSEKKCMDKHVLILTERLSLLLFLSLVGWVIFTIISFSEIQPDWSEEDLIQWAGRQNLFFSLNYFNAFLLTALIVVVFMCVSVSERFPSVPGLYGRCLCANLWRAQYGGLFVANYDSS